MIAGSILEGPARHLTQIASPEDAGMSGAGNAPTEGAISHVSDTARWVAVYRAMESERPDALFRDPFARRLAGAKGAAIVREMPSGAAVAWAMIVRTKVF